MKENLRKVIRFSEKYTQTDMTYFLKGGSWLTLGHITGSLGAFLLAVAFANLLPKEVFGTYKFVISVSSILLFFSLAGISQALTQAVSRGFEGSFFKATKIRVLFGIIGGILSLGLSLYYLINGNLMLSSSFALIAIFIPFIEAFNHYESLLQGRREFGKSIVFNILSRIISIGVLIGTVFLTHNLFFILLAYFLPWTLTRYVFYLITIKKLRPNDLEDPSTISYGKHLSFVGIFGRVSNYIDNILLFHYLGPVQVAIYTFAFAPVEQTRAIYKTIPILAIPKLSNKSVTEIDRQMKGRLIKLFILGIIIAGVYVSLAPFLFKIIFPQYLDAVVFSQLLAIILVFQLPNSFISAATQSKLNITPKSWLYWRNVTHIILILALVIFIPLYGIYGIVIGRTLFSISALTVNLIQWKMFMQGKHL